MDSKFPSSPEQDMSAYSSLIEAMQNDQKELKRLIWEGTYMVSQYDGHGRLPLTWAVHENRLDDVKMLLDCGAEVDGVDRTPVFGGYTSLFLAVANKNEEIAKVLLDAGASVDKLSHKRTPLLLAVQMKIPKMIELLLRYHANPHAVCCLKDGWFQSPFRFALKYGHTKESSLLLEAELFNLASTFRWPDPENVSIHEKTVQVMQKHLNALAASASTENPLDMERMKKEKGEPIINNTIISYDWPGEIQAEFKFWGY